MTELRIRLLGTFQVALDERPVSAFRSDKTRALLAYLAVEADRPHRREALVDLLWPAQSRANGLTSLRQAVWRLRQCLGDDRPGGGFLLCDRHEVQVNPASVYWLDVSELLVRSDACLAHHRAGGVPCDACLASLSAAVVLYRGPFLTGLSPPISVEFDDWLVNTQEGMHWRVLEVLDLLGRGLEARGDYAHAELIAHRELELEPVREPAQRRLLRALALSGQRAQALQEYARWRHRLVERLGVEPDLETTELYQRIMTGQVSPAPEYKAGRRDPDQAQFTNASRHPLSGSHNQPLPHWEDVTGGAQIAGEAVCAGAAGGTRSAPPAHPQARRKPV